MKKRTVGYPLPERTVEEIRRLLEQGQQIKAIKRVRALTGWGLKRAKDYVDALRGR